jgi:hypothetical protein
MVIRLISVSDSMYLPEVHDVFRAILGWNGDLGSIIRVHGQEFNSFRRTTRSTAVDRAPEPSICSSQGHDSVRTEMPTPTSCRPFSVLASRSRSSSASWIACDIMTIPLPS